MDQFVYFVRARLFRPKTLLQGKWPFSYLTTTITLNAPVRDDEDLTTLVEEVQKKLFKSETLLIALEDIDVEQITPLDHYHTKFWDPWQKERQPSKEDAESHLTTPFPHE